jgi:hypothetical protein
MISFPKQNQRNTPMYSRYSILIAVLLVLTGCREEQSSLSIRVSLIADGRERTFAYNEPVTVDEFLQDPRIGIELGDLDRVEPSPFTQITDGLRVTVVRVREETECTQSEIPYRQRTIPNEALVAGEQQVSQAGKNGIIETCFRVIYADGIESERIKTNETEVLSPEDEVIWVGPTGEIEPILLSGTLAYINNRNIWVIRGSSTAKRNLTTSGDVDDRYDVFSLSADGLRLLFGRAEMGDDDGLNTLWFIPDITASTDPVPLIPGNVISAAWLPAVDNTLIYSTAEIRDVAPRVQANNDLWRMRIDPANGESLSIDSMVEASNGGLYGWWGTRFEPSPDGQQIAWVQATQIGLVNSAEGELGTPLLTYPVFRTVVDWSWRATLGWSPDSRLMVATVHGAPIGLETAENSPDFDLSIADTVTGSTAELVSASGIWAAPQFSPFLDTTDSNGNPLGYIAWLQARDPFNSINGEYNLVVADRDGSNQRAVFPEPDQPGISAGRSIYLNSEFAWSPDGRQIAVIYQGNLWVVNVSTGVAHQLTLDGGVSNLVWAR